MATDDPEKDAPVAPVPSDQLTVCVSFCGVFFLGDHSSAVLNAHSIWTSGAVGGTGAQIQNLQSGTKDLILRSPAVRTSQRRRLCFSG